MTHRKVAQRLGVTCNLALKKIVLSVAQACATTRLEALDYEIFLDKLLDQEEQYHRSMTTLGVRGGTRPTAPDRVRKLAIRHVRGNSKACYSEQAVTNGKEAKKAKRDKAL